jgi:hypothetical protein
MNEIAADINKVIEILRRDNPKELERAIMLVRIEDLEQEVQKLKSDQIQFISSHTPEIVKSTYENVLGDVS